MAPKTESLSEWMRSASEKLASGPNPVPSPRNDAERLAAFGLGISWSDLWIRSGDALDEEDRTSLDALVERRASGEPLGYITGSVVFCSLEIACGPGALVPRPETETLVEVALELIADVSSPVVVDIGCGTGAVALAVKYRRSDAKVWATDISEDALRYTRTNSSALGIDIEIACGDAFDGLPDPLRGTVDLIVSNPPYVPDGAGVARDVHAEPAVAVFGGPLGQDVIERLVGQAPGWLKPKGALAIEVGEAWQAEPLGAKQIRADMSGKPRVAWVRF